MLNAVLKRICEIHSNTQDFCFTSEILSINDSHLTLLLSIGFIKISQNRTNHIKCENCGYVAIIKDNLVICQECFTIADINNDKALWQYELNIEKIANLLSGDSSVPYRKLDNFSYLIGKPPTLKAPAMIYLYSGSNFDNIRDEIKKDKKIKHVVVTLSKQKEHGLTTVCLADILTFNDQNEIVINFDYLESQLDDFVGVNKSKTQNAQDSKKEAIKWFKGYVTDNKALNTLDKITFGLVKDYMFKNFGVLPNMARDIWKKHRDDGMKKGGRRKV